MTETSADGVHATGTFKAWVTVALLTLLTVVSYVDRQVLSLLVEELKADFHISDLQFGLLVGPAFIITYNTMLLPLAFLSDRFNRKWLLLGGCALWTSMTFFSALAHTFEQLIVLRSGLAIGEAMLGPISVALIGDLFTPGKRALPSAIFVAGGTVGTTSATFFSAVAYQLVSGLQIVLPGIGEAHRWRLTLIAVAVPGLIFGVAFLLFGTEPWPNRKLQIRDKTSAVSLKQHLLTHGPVYLLVCISTGLVLMASTGLNIWGPAYLMRHFALPQIRAGYLLGEISVVLSLSGLLSFPILVDWRSRGRPRSVAMTEVAMAAILLALPGLALAGFAAELPLCLIGVGIALAGLGCAVSLTTQLIQIYTPSQVKARITAMALFLMFLISIGIGPVLVPYLAAHFYGGSAAVGRALGTMGVGAGLLSIATVAVLRRRLVTIESKT